MYNNNFDNIELNNLYHLKDLGNKKEVDCSRHFIIKNNKYILQTSSNILIHFNDVVIPLIKIDQPIEIENKSYQSYDVTNLIFLSLQHNKIFLITSGALSFCKLIKL